MIIPVRCFTCGTLIADKWDEFVKRIDEGENPQKILDDLNVKRWCCRRMLVSHTDLIEDFLPFT
ncbi:MAG: DNA-directed RNA polymerase subunit N [Candidatus Heimdallarchaeota archaeon]|nr:DNA-directed RNA polymerase subunit N [Candidatus Heimdallarchaeota archaeon]